MKKDVVHQISDVVFGCVCEKDSVNKGTEAAIQLSKRVSVAPLSRSDEQSRFVTSAASWNPCSLITCPRHLSGQISSDRCRCTVAAAHGGEKGLPFEYIARLDD
jgi:hypothetical protein